KPGHLDRKLSRADLAGIRAPSSAPHPGGRRGVRSSEGPASGAESAPGAPHDRTPDRAYTRRYAAEVAYGHTIGRIAYRPGVDEAKGRERRSSSWHLIA